MLWCFGCAVASQKYRRSLLFDHTLSADQLSQSLRDIERSVARMCQLSQTDVRPQLPAEFTQFVRSLRALDARTLRQLYNAAASSSAACQKAKYTRHALLHQENGFWWISYTNSSNYDPHRLICWRFGKLLFSSERTFAAGCRCDFEIDKIVTGEILRRVESGTRTSQTLVTIQFRIRSVSQLFAVSQHHGSTLTFSAARQTMHLLANIESTDLISRSTCHAPRRWKFAQFCFLKHLNLCIG